MTWQPEELKAQSSSSLETLKYIEKVRMTL